MTTPHLGEQLPAASADDYKQQLAAAQSLDEQYVIGSAIRAQFPRGGVIAAAGHSLSRPCAAALEQVTNAITIQAITI